MADRSNEIVGSLFGITPDLYERQLRAQDEERAIKMANLAPGARGAAMIQSGAAGLTRGLGNLLGAEDPVLNRITQQDQLLKSLDLSDPKSLIEGAKQASSMGNQQLAMGLIDRARQAQESIAQTKQRQAAETASLAQAAKTNLTIRQEEELRTKLSQLGPNATEDQVIGVLTQYGPPEKVLAALTTAQSKKESTQARTEASQAANQARIDAAKIAADARIDAAREAGATRLQIAQLQDSARRDLAQLAQSFKEAQSEQLLTPKEKQKREAAYPQATSAINSFESKADSFIKDIEKLRDSPGLSEITGFAAGRLPGLTANGRAAQALYDKIVAKGGFQALQDLRDASKTGGALGNVSNQEGKQLTASFAAIDRRQDAKDVKAALDQAIGDIQGSKTRLKEAYDMTYSYKAEQPKKSLSGEDQQALDWANKNPNDARSAQIKNRLGVK